MNSLETDLSTLVSRLAEAENFSGAVRYRSANGSIFEAAFGFANREQQFANRTTTSFAIASGTKFLTALALGRLIDEGTATLKSRFVDVISKHASITRSPRRSKAWPPKSPWSIYSATPPGSTITTTKK